MTRLRASEAGEPASGPPPVAAASGSALQALAAFPIHPLWLALYPVLRLAAWNLQEIYPFQVVRSLLASLLVVGLLWGVMAILLRDVRRGALLATLASAVFYSYGHLYAVVEDFTLAGVNLGRHRFLAPTLGAVLLVSWWWSIRRSRRHPGLTPGLNGIGLALVLFPAINLLGYLARPPAAVDPAATRIPRVRLTAPPDGALPDIVYIVLDGYARSDYMTEAVGYDNRPFIEFLESQGFYVVERSRANHNHTALSLAATLNLTPAQFLGVRLVRGDYPGPFGEPIQHSLVRRSLESLGYRLVNMRSGYRLTEILDAAVYLSPDDRVVSLGARPNAFEDTLLRTTALQPLLEAGWLDLDRPTVVSGGAGASQREIILSAYAALEDLPDLGAPRFVFVHIVAVHAPFVFQRDGSPVEEDQPQSFAGEAASAPEALDLYREQAGFISDRTRTMLEVLLSSYDRPPVVVLQADHGAGVVADEAQRAAILNAILIREDCREMLYPTLTPVNTFRVIFNCYFDAGLPLVPDDSYLSPWPRYHDYRFEILPPEPVPPG